MPDWPPGAIYCNDLMLSHDPFIGCPLSMTPLYSLTSLNGDVGEMNKKIVHFSGAVVILDCAEPDFQGQQSMFRKQKNEVEKSSVLLAF